IIFTALIFPVLTHSRTARSVKLRIFATSFIRYIIAPPFFTYYTIYVRLCKYQINRKARFPGLSDILKRESFVIVQRGGEVGFRCGVEGGILIGLGHQGRGLRRPVGGHVHHLLHPAQGDKVPGQDPVRRQAVIKLAAALGILPGLDLPAEGGHKVAFLVHSVPLRQAAPALDVYTEVLPVAGVVLFALGLDVEDQYVLIPQGLDLGLPGQGARYEGPQPRFDDHASSPPNGSSSLSRGPSAGLSAATISTAGCAGALRLRGKARGKARGGSSGSSRAVDSTSTATSLSS